jgi:hypothetical protein
MAQLGDLVRRRPSGVLRALVQMRRWHTRGASSPKPRSRPPARRPACEDSNGAGHARSARRPRQRCVCTVSGGPAPLPDRALDEAERTLADLDATPFHLRPGQLTSCWLRDRDATSPDGGSPRGAARRGAARQAGILRWRRRSKAHPHPEHPAPA